MGNLPDYIKARVTTCCAWLLQLDPSGEWERRVRLGRRPTELDPTPLAFEEISVYEDVRRFRWPQPINEDERKG